MLSAAFLGMFQRTQDGLLSGLALVLLLFALSTVFPDSVLGYVFQALFPFAIP
jgi:hypothetical protein